MNTYSTPCAMTLCLPPHSIVRNQIQQPKYTVCPHCSLPFTAPSATASDSPALVDHLSLHHKATQPFTLHPVSQGHSVTWTAVGPVLAIFIITAILLVLAAILVVALFKQRRARHTGRYHTTHVRMQLVYVRRCYLYHATLM